MRVSVVIPTANRRPRMLERAVRSVLSQQRGARVDEVELVVANNSTRALEGGAAELAGAGALRVVDAHRLAGVSFARNEGARQARFEHLAFLDDDDRWEPSFLEEMAGCLVAGELDLVACGIWLDLGDGRRRAGPQLSRRASLSRALARNPGVTGSNLLLRRAAFERLGGFAEDLLTWNDMDLFVRVLLDAELRWSALSRRLVVEDRSPHEQLTQPSADTTTSIVRYLARHERLMGRRARRHVRFRLALAEALVAGSYADVGRLLLRHPTRARQLLGALHKMARGRFIRL